MYFASRLNSFFQRRKASWNRMLTYNKNIICKYLGFSSVHKTYSIQYLLRLEPSLTEFLMLLFLWKNTSSELLVSIPVRSFLPPLLVEGPLGLASTSGWSLDLVRGHFYLQAEMRILREGLPQNGWIWQLDPNDIPHTINRYYIVLNWVYHIGKCLIYMYIKVILKEKGRMTFAELIRSIKWSQKLLNLLKFPLACQFVCMDVTITIMSFLFLLYIK